MAYHGMSTYLRDFLSVLLPQHGENKIVPVESWWVHDGILFSYKRVDGEAREMDISYVSLGKDVITAPISQFQYRIT